MAEAAKNEQKQDLQKLGQKKEDDAQQMQPQPHPSQAALQPQSPQALPQPSALEEGLMMGELAVRLDSYDDIFSDFDPRPHSRRELSEDLLKELNRRFRENPKGGLEVRFYIPSTFRDAKLENIIKKRLKEHFLREMQKVKEQMDEQKARGIKYALSGIALLSAELFLTLWWPELVWVRVVSIILTPAGWFSFWTGMEKILEIPSSLQQQHRFYEKFSKCNYIFVSEEKE